MTFRWIKLGELEAEVGRCEALYAAVTEENRVAEEESKLLTSLRARLEREMVQIGNTIRNGKKTAMTARQGVDHSKNFRLF